MLETSAGALLYTTKEDMIYYLVIRDFHGNYGFPKGHLEKDETLKQAALREIREETGIIADIDTAFEEELNYVMPGGIAKRSVYFLASYHDQEPVPQPEEVQEIRLCTYEEALAILTFQGMKDILKKAETYRKGKNHE